jgi:hypothetical protein
MLDQGMDREAEVRAIDALSFPLSGLDHIISDPLTLPCRVTCIAVRDAVECLLSFIHALLRWRWTCLKSLVLIILRHNASNEDTQRTYPCVRVK